MLTSKLETELRNNQNLYSTGSSYKTDGASGVFSLGTQFKINKDENQVKKLFESKFCQIYQKNLLKTKFLPMLKMFLKVI